MFTKIFIVLIMLIILSALGSSLFFLVRDEGKTRRTVKALTWRIGLSFGLFLLLFLLFRLGFIHPHAIILNSAVAS